METQVGDKQPYKLREKIKFGMSTHVSVHPDGFLPYGNRLCVPRGDIKEELLVGAHSSTYFICPNSIKMYKDSIQHFWWPKMKKKIARYVARCLVC